MLTSLVLFTCIAPNKIHKTLFLLNMPVKIP
uniref:Uncharacterized protein n=1 Tax=Populus trichocarpa TaxID=3694 RepID=A0A3N7FI75_POPTR